MKDVLVKMNDRSSNMCMYLICLVLLLGIGCAFLCAARLHLPPRRGTPLTPTHPPRPPHTDLGYDLAKKKGMV
jgi:hypothetical protein